MSEFLIQGTTANELCEIAKEINGTTEKIKGSEVVRHIREGMERHVDTATITDWSYYFYGGARTHTLSKCDMSNGKYFENCFFNNLEIVDAGTINLIGIPTDESGTHCRNIFSGCENMVSLTLKLNSIRTSEFISRSFYTCTALTNLIIDGTINVNSDTLNFAYSPNLTVESLVSILNAFEDNNHKDHKWTVYFGSTNLSKLTLEQKQIAEDKNISIQ